MKTRNRSSTFRWTVVFLIVVIAATRAGAPSAAPQAPTPVVESYFITWNATGKGGFREFDSRGVDSIEYNHSSATQGAAIATFKYEGKNLAKVTVHSRIVAGYLTDETDEKEHRVSEDCPDHAAVHWHDSYQPIESIIGMDWWMYDGGAPRKQADGSWVILYPFHGLAAFGGAHQASYLHLTETSGCSIRCLEEHFPGCVKWATDPPKIYSTKIEPRKSNCPQPLCYGWSLNALVSDMKSADPSFFSKEMEIDVSPSTFFLGAGKNSVKVKWTVTIRRIGKCLVGGSIPLDGKDAGINDEDVEMGVEHGGEKIDPDKGVADLNIRVTCDQVPIENAEVDVKVDVQKNTGGHTHDPAGRPRGSLKWNGTETKLTDVKPSIKVNTDDDGRVHLNFKPGKAVNHDDLGIAGLYRITATSVRFPMRKAEAAVEAKVDSLSNLDSDSNYVDDVVAAGHTTADNATAATKQGLVQFASAFHDAQVEHNKALGDCKADQWPLYPLWVIDVSLPFGGLYDYQITTAWDTPHQTHGRGDGVDFSAHTRSNSKSSATKWPDDGYNVTVCGGYRIAPQGWLMMKMWELGTKYGHWDEYDLCTDYKADHPKCPGDPKWHLHVNQ
jgi:hypothetical protein